LGHPFSFSFMNIFETVTAYTNNVTKFKPMVYPFNMSDNPVFVAKYFLKKLGFRLFKRGK
jgi:hypothetical protein